MQKGTNEIIVAAIEVIILELLLENSKF